MKKVLLTLAFGFGLILTANAQTDCPPGYTYVSANCDSGCWTAIDPPIGSIYLDGIPRSLTDSEVLDLREKLNAGCGVAPQTTISAG